MTDYLQPCRRDAQEACATESLCCSGRCRQGRDCPHNLAAEPKQSTLPWVLGTAAVLFAAAAVIWWPA